MGQPEKILLHPGKQTFQKKCKVKSQTSANRRLRKRIRKTMKHQLHFAKSEIIQVTSDSELENIWKKFHSYIYQVIGCPRHSNKCIGGIGWQHKNRLITNPHLLIKIGWNEMQEMQKWEYKEPSVDKVNNQLKSLKIYPLRQSNQTIKSLKEIKCTYFNIDSHVVLTQPKFVRTFDGPGLPLAEHKSRIEDKIYIMGRAENMEGSQCIAGGEIKDIKGNQRIIGDITIKEGASGSPILNSSGKAIGIVWGMQGSGRLIGQCLDRNPWKKNIEKRTKVISLSGSKLGLPFGMLIVGLLIAANQ